MHAGKLLNDGCHIGWGGLEIVITQFDVLTGVNDPRLWYVGLSAAVSAGQENGQERYVCRAEYIDGNGVSHGVHPGKYVAGACNIGWGGREIVISSFTVLHDIAQTN
jgi:hypothetical protein